MTAVSDVLRVALTDRHDGSSATRADLTGRRVISCSEALKVNEWWTVKVMMMTSKDDLLIDVICSSDYVCRAMIFKRVNQAINYFNRALMGLY